MPEIGPTYGVSDPGSEFGRAGTERRLPLLIKDVAGLVPGAWQGLGRGNAFLNDLVDADVLLHIVDVSVSSYMQHKPNIVLTCRSVVQLTKEATV